jgi:hypothetical protein
MWISPRRRQSPVLPQAGLTNLAGGRQLLLNPPIDVAAPHRASHPLDPLTPFALVELKRIPDRAGEPCDVEGIARQRIAQLLCCAREFAEDARAEALARLMQNVRRLSRLSSDHGGVTLSAGTVAFDI